MVKDKTLIPVIKALVEQGISAQAAAKLVDSGYSMRRIKTLFKELPAADLSKEEIAEYRIRYSKEQSEIAANHSAKTIAAEYSLSRHQVSRIKGGHYPPWMSQSDREEIRGKLLRGIWAKKFASAHSVRKIQSDLGLSNMQVTEIPKRERKEPVKPQFQPMDIPTLVVSEPDSIRSFLTMQLSRNPCQLAAYY